MAASTHTADPKPRLGSARTLPPSAVVLPAAAFHPLALWHLLSLDAPTIAALWVFFIARAAHIALPWTAPAAMFLAVWVLYAADRLLDARASKNTASSLEARHHFHAAHTPAFFSGIALAAPLLLLLLHDIPPTAIRLYLLLGVLLLVWLLLIHLPPATARLPKELAVGIFFPAAVFISTVARAPWLRLTLLPEAVLFAAVCCLNCLYIFAWEHPASATDSHWTTHWAVQHLRPLTVTTAAAGILVAAFAAFTPQANFWHLAAAPAFASALSAAWLLALHVHRSRFSSLHLRVAADLCLLTPLLILPVLR